MSDAATPEARPFRLGVGAALAVLVLGALMWQVRAVLSPFVLYPLLVALLWPHRIHADVRRLLLATGALTAVWFLWQTGRLLAPFLLATAIAYLLAPATAALERRRVPRSVAILVVLLPFLAALAVLVLLLLPVLERQVVNLAGQMPTLIRRGVNWLLELRTRFLAGGGALLTNERVTWLRDLDANDLVRLADDQWVAVAQRIWRALLGIGRGVGALLGILGYVVVTPVVTFYLLRSWTRFTARLEDLVPPPRRANVFAFLSEYDRLLGRYVRGQLTEATLVAVLTGGTLALLGFPGALLVGVIAGLGNLIPYIGLPLSILPGLLLALVSPEPVTALLKLLAVFAVVQFIDGSITGPRIVGESVGLDPVWVMIALVLFGSLLGFVGLLVAVPLAVAVKMLGTRAVVRYKTSQLYVEGRA